jgi:amidase
MTDLIRLTATETVALLRAKKVSPAELIDAALKRMDAVEPLVNALPVRCPERARKAAEKAAGAAPLYGLPVAIKDSMDVAGVRSTQGSPIFADRVPERSDIQVEMLEKRGAVVLARSNAPEFAAGANTFNEVFGATRNPWDTRMTCGGSSGGSAVALATGEVWLANGSDLGGSLRIPASYCSVVGFRPSPGVVAHGPGVDAFNDLSVSGPMARNVADVALLLDAMAGLDSRDPLSLPAPSRSFVETTRERPKQGLRVGWSADLGYLPVDPEVRELCTRATQRFAEAGGVVDDARLDLSDAQEAFQTLRALGFATKRKDLLETHRDKLKPEVVWNIEKGLKLDSDAIGRALRGRAAIYARLAAFFESHDVLATPTVMVPPFPVERRWIEEVAGHRFDNYVDWLAHTYAITLTRCPAISLPCGFTKTGLPVGLQLVAPPMRDAALLSASAALEEMLGISSRLPIEPKKAAG